MDVLIKIGIGLVAGLVLGGCITKSFKLEGILAKIVMGGAAIFLTVLMFTTNIMG